ncbi:hypothetical protein BN1708_018773, partial [Verticillium longisporum]
DYRNTPSEQFARAVGSPQLSATGRVR